ncbi:glycosyltransferase family 4 protein [Aestuariivivens sediminis]|uniref:glycosyltransferase family 4 protein n=1 Tax=Aestuariivivens sediminis TaxID=2913557 RepID=UPI001F56B864|nr:glycosyltransferase family 4 protein [Aestuariivivens sediminis]
MKELLIITHYFPPEIGAASNRIFQLARGLHNRGFKVSVLTPLPNYPNGKVFKAYQGRYRNTSWEEGLLVHRLWLYASNSKNTLLRLGSMLSYSISLIWYVLWHRLPDTVIIQSPPLVVAFTSVVFLRSKKRRLILNVSDLWPLAGLELGAFKKGLSYRLLKTLERYNYKQADLILGQSQEILSHIHSIFPEKATILYRNFPDFQPPKPVVRPMDNAKIKLVYAGLLGVAQGIYTLCQALDYTKIEFHIYGAGSEQARIISFIENHPDKDLVYHGELTRVELHKVLGSYDLGIIPLRHRIYGSVPSKLFEYARLGLPVLYFGGGEGETLVHRHKLGWVAKAGDYAHLNRVIANIDPAELDIRHKRTLQGRALDHFDFTQQLQGLLTAL